MKSTTLALGILLFSVFGIKAQNFEQYKSLGDTSLLSLNLGFVKNMSVMVPIEWQSTIDKKFPLIILFDKQNQRNHNYILRTIDYLTVSGQMPASVIVSVESSQEYRYLETVHKASAPGGLARLA